MADNVIINEKESGTSIAADEISGAKYQRIKIIHGADGVNDGDVSSANPLPVEQTGVATEAKQDTIIGHLDGVEGFLGTIAGDTTDIEAAIEIIDDAIVTDDAAFTPGTTKVLMSGFQADETSSDSVNEGDAGAARMTLDRKLIVAPYPANYSADGLSVFRSIDLDETEEDVKGSSGNLYGYYFANLNASWRFLKFYNNTAANVTVGTTTPVKTLPLPPNSAGHIMFPIPIPFSTAICAAATTGVADNDTGAPGANEVVLNAYYK